MTFQIQKEYIYIVAAGLAFFVFGIYNFPNDYIFLFLIFYLFYIANFPYKIQFIENNFIIVHRLIGKKQIKLRDIINVTRGTHKTTIYYNNKAINISHLIDRVDTLANLVENSIRPEKSIAPESEIEDLTIREDASSSDLIKAAVRVLIIAIITSVLGVIYFIKMAKSISY